MTGLGVTNLTVKTGKRDAGMTWKYEHVLPMAVIFDPSDMTMDFSDSRFVIRDRFLQASYCAARWPKLKKYFDRSRVFDLESFDSHTAWMHMTAVHPGANGYTGNIVQVSELQWKEYETCYYGTDADGFAKNARSLSLSSSRKDACSSVSTSTRENRS